MPTGIRDFVRRHMPATMKRAIRHVRQLESSQMTWRVFDLRKKRLVAMEGFGLYVMPNDYIGANILATQTWEPHVTHVIRHELREGDVFLDLGANIGYFSMLASSLVKATGRVLAFEPNPQNLQLIYESKLYNQFANLTVYPYAASDRAELLRFATIGSNGGIVNGAAPGNRCLLVQSAVLDDFLSSVQRIDVVKIDVEAHEPAALRGMARLLRKHKPRIITEFHPWAMRINNVEAPEEYLSQLERLDYCLSIILPTGDLTGTLSSHDVMAYWASLGSETAHIDLFAKAIAD